MREIQEQTMTKVASSRSTIIVQDLEASGKPAKEDSSDPQGDKGESAIPEGKRLEALERLDWDWQHDLDNPRNWKVGKKWCTAGVESFYLFINVVATSMMAPALPNIREHFGISNPTTLNMSLTVFLLAYAIGPLFLGPLSEMMGRKWMSHSSNMFFIVFNLACAFAPNVGALITFRFLAGLGASAPSVVSAAVIGDLFSEQDRAMVTAVLALGSLLLPSFAPVAGGFIAGTIGFKWIFIIIAVVAGIGTVFGILILQETYAPYIQIQRAQKEVESTGKTNLEYIALLEQRQAFFQFTWINMTRPFALLFGSFICFILSLYMGLAEGYYYFLFATFPSLFQETYGFSSGLVGLAYLGPAVGFCVASLFGTYVADGIYIKLSKKNRGVRKPEMRIPALIVASLLVPVGLLWYGWSAEAKTHWIMPIIGASIFACGMMGTFISITLYLMDSFRHTASAMAAASFLRSVMAFIFPLFGQQMFNALTLGPGYSLCAGLAIVIGIPFPIWIYYCGERIRSRSDLNR